MTAPEGAEFRLLPLMTSTMWDCSAERGVRISCMGFAGCGSSGGNLLFLFILVNNI